MSVIVALAKNMLVTEAPISKKVLYRKLLAVFGISRLGSRLETVIDNAMLKVEKKETIENGNVFYFDKSGATLKMNPGKSFVEVIPESMGYVTFE